MDTNELRKMTAVELTKELLETKRELFNLRMQKRTGQLTRPHLAQEAKKKVSRIKTILREKELMGINDE